MFLIDYHTHSQLSPDADFPLAEMAAAGAAAGLREMCITDHYDRMKEHGGGFQPDYDWAPALAQYRAVLPTLPEGFTLRLGIEYGSAPVDPEYAQSMLALPELDFVIGSLHNRSEKLGGEDFFYGDYQNEGECYAALDDYFTSMERLVELPGCYDVLGHIIYPLRYMPQSITLDRYRERIDAILGRVVANDRGIELNTYNGRTIEPWRWVLERYRAHGGEQITLGSDAHFPERVGLGLEAGAQLLLDTGFRYVTTYEKHRPAMHRIEG
ncbi:hypothetical protein B5E80_04350 [Flavonifractor sp. An135]|nr:histidinol-phosphatase HisJ family protein [Flavonifractor sp. An135]OUQ25423.1 hypothetical protein B5E80_04350 [Flavonifractor sp. An135]